MLVKLIYQDVWLKIVIQISVYYGSCRVFSLLLGLEVYVFVCFIVTHVMIIIRYVNGVAAPSL